MSKVSIIQSIIDVLEDEGETKIQKGSMVYDQLKQCVNGYDKMRELLKDLYPEFDSGQIAQHSARANRMRNKLELRIKQTLKESE